MNDLIFLILDKHWNKDVAYQKLEPFFAYLQNKIPKEQFEVLTYFPKELHIWNHFRTKYNVSLVSFDGAEAGKPKQGMPMLIHLKKAFNGTWLVHAEIKIEERVIDAIKAQYILPTFPDPVVVPDPPPAEEKKSNSTMWLVAGGVLLALFFLNKK